MVNADKNLLKQCDDMLTVTSDSYVFIYSRQGIYSVPAFNFLRPSRYLHHKRIDRFFGEFLKCFIGDHKIVPVIKQPEDLLRYCRIVLYLNIHQNEKVNH